MHSLVILLSVAVIWVVCSAGAVWAQLDNCIVPALGTEFQWTINEEDNMINMVAYFPAEAADGWIAVGFKSGSIHAVDGKYRQMRDSSITLGYFNVEGTDFVPVINDYFSRDNGMPELLNNTHYDSAAIAMDEEGERIALMMSRPLTTGGASESSWFQFTDEEHVLLVAYSKKRPSSPTEIAEHDFAVLAELNFFDDIGQQCDSVWTGGGSGGGGGGGDSGGGGGGSGGGDGDYDDDDQDRNDDHDDDDLDTSGSTFTRMSTIPSALLFILHATAIALAIASYGKML